MSSIDLSPEALTRLKALAQKATPGPWHLTGIPDVVDILSVGNRLICSPCKMGDAAFIAAVHPGLILAMCDKIERLSAMRMLQAGEAAISLLNAAISSVVGEEIKPIKVGTVCPYCGYESSSFEEATAHDGTCPKHPAVMKAVRLEKEADWLAERLHFFCDYNNYCNECALYPSFCQENIEKRFEKHVVENWREQARKASE